MITCRECAVIQKPVIQHDQCAMSALSVCLCWALLLYCLSVLCIPEPVPACTLPVLYKGSLIRDVSGWNGTPATHGTIHELLTGRRLTFPLFRFHHYHFVKHAYFLEVGNGTQDVR